MDHNVSAHGALISNTMLCEVSRLFVGDVGGLGWNDDFRNRDRVADLLNLIDAVVLYDDLYFLPASLPADVGELAFRERLLHTGIASTFSAVDDHREVSSALIAAIQSVEPMVSKSWNNKSLTFADVEGEIDSMLALRRTAKATIEDGYDEFPRGVTGDTFDEVIGNLAADIQYASSGAYESSAGNLRAMYYTFMSEHHGIPYWPSVARRSIEERFPNYFAQPARQQIYDRLTEALDASLSLVTEDMGGRVVQVPPFAALALSRAATPNDLIGEIFALRDEFASFRTRMTEMEKAQREASSIRDRLAIRAKIDGLCKEVARPFEVPSALSLQPVLRFVPDVEAAVDTPTNPKSWLKLFLNMPLDRVIRWWMRRPVAKLVSASWDVVGLDDYGRLVSKHFGEDLACNIIAAEKAMLSR
jgi:hypothetical protein